jgi:hypothetical protein
MLMARTVVAIAAAVVLSACSDGPPNVHPSSTTVTAGPPQTIALNSVNGIGASAGQVFVTARVYDSAGLGVPSTTVQFATTVGTVQPSIAATDGGGLAQVTVSANVPTTISAVAGSVRSTLDVTPISR